MAIKLTGESFLQCVRQSNLIEPEQLNRLLQEFRQHGVRTDDSRALADELIARNILTRWQADKLLQGKHKGFTLGKYRLQSLLGKGGMSSVYLAEHVLMRRRCAIKVLPSKRVNDSSYLGRFHREAQAVAALDHPNIVRAYDVDKEVEKDTEIHFLVMEYVEGQSLHDLVTQNGVMSYVEAAEFIRQAACGLEHAHQAGMVHRDIKPGNLLADNNRVVKILDLGLARFFNEGDEQSLTVAHDEKVLGTADYLAPEQALDSHRVDARADIYSLGCTFYFLLTGHPPFTEGTLAQRLMAHQTKMPPALDLERADIPPDLNAIILKMMAKKLPERFQSADEVDHALADWLEINGGDGWRRLHGRTRGHSAPRSDVPASPAASRSQETATNGARNDTLPSGNRPARRSEPQMPVWTPPSETPHPAPRTPAPSRTPPPTPVAREDDGLNAFLSNLDVEPPSVAKPLSSKSSPRVVGPPSSGNIPVAEPVSDRQLPVAEAVPVRGGSGPKLAVAVPIAQSPPYAAPVEAFPSVAVAEAVPVAVPMAERVETPAPRSRVRSRGSKSAIKLPRIPVELLKDRRVQIGGGGVLGLILLTALAMSFFGEDASDPSKPPDKPDVATPSNGGEGPEDPRGLMGKDVTVGPGGHFETISAALEYVGKHWRPLGRKETQVIKVPGGKTYAERIVADNSSMDAFSHGIRIVSDGPSPAILKPSGAEPVIKLTNRLDKFTVEGFEVVAEGKPVAIEIGGFLNGLRLKNLKISGYTQSGVLGKGPMGIGGYDEEAAIETCRFQAGSPAAVGVKLQSGGASDNPSQVHVRDCRFVGPMAAAIVLASDAGHISIRQNLIAETEIGVKFEGAGRVWRSVLVGNNSFYKVKRPIVFTDQPGELSSNLGFYRNLFAEVTGPEAVVEKGYNRDGFLAVLESSIAGMDGNWTSRPNTPVVPGEIEYFFNRGGRKGVGDYQFASTNPNDPKFLAPTEKSPQKSVAASGPKQLPFVGAIGASK